MEIFIINLMQKIIIITGTSSGIGLEIAEFLGKKGHKVYGLSRKITKSIFFETIPTDITDNEQIKKSINQIISQEKTIDLLINNAGMGMVGSVEDSTKEEITNLFNLNLIGSVQMMAAVIPVMRQQNFGQIINISSIGSEMGLPFRGFYSASKSALDKVTEAIRYEVEQWNIQICSLHLGDIKTNIADHRIRTAVSSPYENIFKKVYSLMNKGVNNGFEPQKVAKYIEQLILKKYWKPHYYFGKFGQKIGVPLKWILPQKFYEFLMKKYNGL